MDIATLRRLVALDENDPLSRFALAKKLWEEQRASSEALEEAAGHLRFSNDKAPEHLATYHVLAKVLVALGHKDEARPVLEEGIRRVAAIGEGRGRDLGPAMSAMLERL